MEQNKVETSHATDESTELSTPVDRSPLSRIQESIDDKSVLALAPAADCSVYVTGWRLHFLSLGSVASSYCCDLADHFLDQLRALHVSCQY